MFSGDHLIKASLDEDLRHGFLSTYSLEDFFTYHYDQFPERVTKWIWDDDGWQELRAHHSARGALRRWLPRSEMSAGGALDIRPGDVVLIDPDRKGAADHIVLAASYDPATNTLVTIGGNDSGFVLMGPKDKEPGADAKLDTAEAATGLELKPGGGGKVAVGVHQVTPDGKQAGGRLRRRAAVAGRPRGAHLRVQAARQAAAASEAREVSSKAPPPSQPAASEIPPRSVPSTTARSRGSA